MRDKWPVGHDGHADAHRAFAGVFLHHLCGKTCRSADDEQEFRGDRRISQIVEDGRHCAVDVDGQRFDRVRHRGLQRPDKGHASARLPQLLGHREQCHGARVFVIHPMAHARKRRRFACRVSSATARAMSGIDRDSRAARLEALGNQCQAGEPCAPVGVADREYACRHRRFGREPVARGDHPRRRRRGARSVIRDGNQHGIEQPALTAVRHPTADNPTTSANVRWPMRSTRSWPRITKRAPRWRSSPPCARAPTARASTSDHSFFFFFFLDYAGSERRRCCSSQGSPRALVDGVLLSWPSSPPSQWISPGVCEIRGTTLCMRTVFASITVGHIQGQSARLPVRMGLDLGNRLHRTSRSCGWLSMIRRFSARLRVLDRARDLVIVSSRACASTRASLVANRGSSRR